MKSNEILSEYLGPDGFKVSHSHVQYLEKCAEFVRKANQFKNENIRRKNSVIHSQLLGYDSIGVWEKDVIDERDRQIQKYHDSYDVASFGDDKPAVFQSSSEKSKRIRIIREVSEPRWLTTAGSETVEDSWFVRFCTLSRFIQAVRIIIFKQRLEKRLTILKSLTSTVLKTMNHGESVVSTDEEKNQDAESPCTTRHSGCPTICRY